MKEDILLELYEYCSKKYSQKEMAEILHKSEAEFPYHIEGMDRENFIRNFMDWLVLEKTIPETGKRITESYVEEHPEFDEKKRQSILNTKNLIVSKFVVISKDGVNLKLKNMADGSYYPVVQASNNPEMQPNTIIVGRIFPYGDIYRFAGVMILQHTPMIVDPDIMMHAYEKREIERIEGLILSPSTKLTAILNKYPFQWIDGMCEALSVDITKKKNEKVKDIAQRLATELPTIIGRLPEQSRSALAFIAQNNGMVKYNLLKEYGDEISWWWNEHPPASAIGILRLRGLIAVGKIPQGSKLYKMALIPKEIRQELEKMGWGKNNE